MSRRTFLAEAGVASAVMGFQMARAGEKPKQAGPNERLNIATVGAGGQAASNIRELDQTGQVNFVAFSDVDDERAGKAYEKFPSAKKYYDVRRMLEEMETQIDAVVISTPDHTHAPAAYMAMKMGKHVYVQKPLTHTVAEARLLTRTAAETGVMTQMGNQGHCGDGIRQVCEMIWSGAVGVVREAHVWTHRPVWDNQGVTEALPPEIAPAGLDCDSWLGTAPWRPYHPKLAPHAWRATLDLR